VSQLRSVVALCLGASVAFAQEPAPPPVKLEYAFERLAGKTAVYTVETEQKVAQEMRGEGGGEVRSWIRQTHEQRYEAPDEEGVGRVIITAVRIEARLEEDGRTTSYDSQAGGGAGAFAALAEKLDKPITLKVARDGEVLQVRGVPSSERGAYHDAFLELPERPVALGDGWDRRERKPMPPLGTLSYLFRYRLAAVEPGEPARHRIEATIRATLEEVTLPSREVNVEITDQSGSGALVVDADGLLIEQSLDSRLEITVKAAAGTQIQRVEMRTRQALLEVRGP
jgi:hypothetical protein